MFNGLDQAMSVSVIIPVYNSSSEECVKSFIGQNVREIIIVDDGSADTYPFSSALRLRETTQLSVKTIFQAHGGPASARNRGAKAAIGDVLIFTDSDCVVDKFFVSTMTRMLLSGSDVGAVSGCYALKNPESTVARFIQCWISYQYQNMRGEIDVFASCYAAIRKKVFDEVGGFNESFKMASGEDNDLAYRIRKAGYRILFSPSSTVYHAHPESLVRFLKQQFWRAVWRVKLHKKHGFKQLGNGYIRKRTLLIPPAIGGLGLVMIVLLIKKIVSLPIFVLSLLGSLVVANGNFTRYAYKYLNSVKMASFCFVLRSLMITVWIFGGIYGTIKFARSTRKG